MKILFPQNIFAKILSLTLPEELRSGIEYREASAISTEIEKGNVELALIPSCDLIKHQEFYISRKVAISFDGQLSNSYIYFIPGQNSFSELFLSGDVSTNEVILGKILFKERYSSDIQIHLESENKSEIKNCLVVGDKNYENNKYLNGLSFADELSTMLFLPYVNFVIVSKEEKHVNEFNRLTVSSEKLLENDLEAILDKLELKSEQKDFITDNFNSVYFEMTENEIEGLIELIRLPYYHGIVNDMIDLKLV